MTMVEDRRWFLSMYINYTNYGTFIHVWDVLWSFSHFINPHDLPPLSHGSYMGSAEAPANRQAGKQSMTYIHNGALPEHKEEPNHAIKQGNGRNWRISFMTIVYRSCRLDIRVFSHTKHVDYNQSGRWFEVTVALAGVWESSLLVFLSISRSQEWWETHDSRKSQLYSNKDDGEFWYLPLFKDVWSTYFPSPPTHLLPLNVYEDGN